ncbi:hypothetical protein [Mesorhizobium sp. J428]|uniref:hypothetical protein n=1 Tax=Mesorhizobium sp. J428 TaxID=2898440 RepID=UPI0021512451|nr:hypothetical protein [Mesorhizobium sp. J428]MCR5860480.1 hypothetical protein [Mesorhizobium sp. J428]MCR5860633.1 hypothetical protein [Mesorhizobium sp. J428]
MTNFGQHRLARISWFRAALALLFLVMASLQPGMVAMAKSAMHPSSVAGLIASSDAKVYTNSDHEHGSDATTEVDGASAKSHHGNPKTADICCDTHCAPSQAVPVSFPPFPQPCSGVLALEVSAAIMPGEQTDFLRPPRT